MIPYKQLLTMSVKNNCVLYFCFSYKKYNRSGYKGCILGTKGDKYISWCCVVYKPLLLLRHWRKDQATQVEQSKLERSVDTVWYCDVP